MTTKRPTQTEATTLRIPTFDRDDDQKYSLETVFLELARYIRRRHGPEKDREFRKAMAAIFNATDPNRYEHIRSVLEGRINLELQRTLDDLHLVANSYHPPIRH